jgi:hypothetical protein
LANRHLTNYHKIIFGHWSSTKAEPRFFQDYGNSEADLEQRRKEEQKRLDKMEILRLTRIERMKAFQARTDIPDDEV